MLRAVMVLSRVMSMGKHAVTLTYGSYGITIPSHVAVEMTSMVLYNYNNISNLSTLCESIHACV